MGLISAEVEMREVYSNNPPTSPITAASSPDRDPVTKINGTTVIAMDKAISRRILVLPPFTADDLSANKASIGNRQANNIAAWLRFANRPTALLLLVMR